MSEQEFSLDNQVPKSGQGELQSIEFKPGLKARHVREGLENLCGMINSDAAQGVVVFGVANNGEVTGIEPGNLDTAQRTLVDKIREGFDPPIVADIQIREQGGKKVLVLSATRGPTVPYHEYDGRAWIKEGTTHRALKLSEKQSLSRRRSRDLHTGPWKCDRCGSWVGTWSGWEVTKQGLVKSYACECGGEFWPAT